MNGNEILTPEELEKKGMSFTEILIVVLIVLILSGLAVSTLNSSRMKARDAKRIADVRRATTALNIFVEEEDGFPSAEQLILGNPDAAKLCDANVGGIVPAGSECSVTYLNMFSRDPKTSNNYVYMSNGKEFAIYFSTEGTTELGLAGDYVATKDGIRKR